MEGNNSENQQVEAPLNLTYEELEIILSKIVSPNPNKEEIQNTNEMIKKYSKNILCVEGFLLQIKNNPNFKVRQLSAILLYRKLEKHWLSLDTQTQNTLSGLILTLLSTEKNFLVLKAIANLIFKIAKRNLINNEWTDLLNYIFTDPQKYSAEQANLFELNLYIMSELIESCSFYLKEKFELIKSILQISLNHGSQRMKEHSTKCLGNLVRSLEKEELSNFKDIIPSIFVEMRNFTEETVLHIYETFCDFQLNSLDFFDSFFDNYIIPYSLEFLQNLEFNGNTKLVISEFLMMVSECKKKIFTKNDCQFLKQTLEVAFKLACRNEENENGDDLSDFSIGLRMIESLSLTVQSKYYFPLSTQYINKLITSNDVFQRRAGVNSLRAIVEGCTGKVKEILGEIVDTLVNIFLTDPDIKVRSSAILAIDNLTLFCEPEINEFHAKIIPTLVQGMASKDDEIIEKCLIELNYFCKNLDVELEDYVADLLPRLIFLLENHKSVNVQKECLFALAAIIGGAQNHIDHTLLPILETCRSIISSRTSEEENELRANSLNCVAQIAFAIKKEKFSPYMQFFTKFASECIKSNVYEFQESGFTYFGSIATLLGEEITNDLTVLIEAAINVLKDDSGIINEKEKDEFGLDSDSEDDDCNKIDDVYINNSFVDAKCAAILAITRFAQATPCAFLNHIQNVFVYFEALWDYINNSVNLELISAYHTILVALKSAEEKINPNSLMNEESLSKKMWNMEVLPKFEKIFQESDCKEEIVRVLEALYDIITDFDKTLFINNNSLERIIQICLTLLDNKATCQIKNDEDEDDPDHDEQILGGVVDIYLVASEKLENDFHNYFTTSFPYFKKYLSIKRSEHDRSLIFGCIADILKHCKVSVKFFIEILLNACDENIKKINKKKYEDLNRHIAYLIGVLFESDPDSSRTHFSSALQMLQTIFESSTTVAKDNVIAALCRVSIGLNLNGQDCQFFTKIVETILTNSPLTNDAFENPMIFKFIQFLFDKLDMAGYEVYLENILKTIKSLVLNEIKCGTSKSLIKEIKNYLELLNNNETLKNAIEKFVGNMSVLERERFINTIRNA